MLGQNGLRYIEYELKKKGFQCFHEPFSKTKPDMIALTDDMMVIIELKPRVDRYTVIQLKSYIRKREFFEILSGRKVEFWLVTPYVSQQRREEIEELGVKIIERPVLPF